MRPGVHLLVASAALALAGCGDDEESFSCRRAIEEFEPCGGEIVGEWEVETFCLESSFEDFIRLPPACDGADVDMSGTRVTGTAHFRADGTFATTTSTKMHVTLSLDDACLQALARTSEATGREICGQMASTEADEELRLSCSYSSSHCRCTMTGQTVEAKDEGTYEVLEGGRLAMGGDPADEPGSYCVSDDRLLVRPETPGDAPEVLSVYRRK